VAAINNNPFEYWITYPDAKYMELMQGVQDFVSAPRAMDVPVHEVCVCVCVHVHVCVCVCVCVCVLV
jgi:hypothetical protein